VKLARTLWIIPLSLLVLLLNKKENAGKGKIKIPWFILYFIVAILIAGFIPAGQSAYSVLSYIGKRGMVLALFMIGSGFNFADLKTVGVRPFLLGVFLWIIISVSTLFFFL
ncbi:MAG: putative sulfate exporter family transporter, partial [Bacteroidales bacterium]|nr:putative sulfate exporter family transporter [Bacteroidales bacterium]